MPSDQLAISVGKLAKRYEIYATPRDRLKQLVMSQLRSAVSRLGTALGSRRSVRDVQYFQEFWALKDVSFQVRRGETFGIIGRNGSGKSTLLQIIAGTMSPTAGDVETHGPVAALLELGSGFNPEFTGRENVYLNCAVMGMSRKETESRLDRIIEFADIGDFIDQPVKTYSSGMFVRLGFAVQAHVDAKVVIIDEALAVGDVFFRQKCYARLEELKKSGAAILLVSHSMADIEQFCERSLLLDQGRQVFLGASSEAAKRYYLLHQGERSSTLARVASRGISADPSQGGQPAHEQRPPREAFINLQGKAQVSNGGARCVGIALMNAAGEACNSFRQGDTAVVYSEFELLRDSEVPICGLVIRNERGIIVHGKNAWQCEGQLPRFARAGQRISCRQEVQLKVAQGDYSFEVGIASIGEQEYIHRNDLSNDEVTTAFERLCHLPDVGMFSVGLAVRHGRSYLTHHGLADLPGTIQTQVLDAQAGKEVA